jgi:DNA polymerase-3 subunit epsilon
VTLDATEITERYLAAFPDRWSDTTPLEQVRFAVFDAETTSADARSAEAVTLGAITVDDGQILLEELFEAMIRLDHNLAAVTVHGITQQQSMGGMDEPEALLRFLDYLGDAVIIGHHIGFDIAVMSRALERTFGFGLKNRSIDTMEIALLLHQDGVLEDPGGFSLDHLLSLFGVKPHDRHTAAGDAYLTAQVLQRLLYKANVAGRTSLGALSERPERAAGS